MIDSVPPRHWDVRVQPLDEEEAASVSVRKLDQASVEGHNVKQTRAWVPRKKGIGTLGR